jgi:hypothetical protein
LSDEERFLNEINETLQRWGMSHEFRFVVSSDSSTTLLRFTIRCARCGQSVPFSIHCGQYRGHARTTPVVKDVVRQIWIGVDDCDHHIMSGIMKS